MLFICVIIICYICFSLPSIILMNTFVVFLMVVIMSLMHSLFNFSDMHVLYGCVLARTGVTGLWGFWRRFYGWIGKEIGYWNQLFHRSNGKCYELRFWGRLDQEGDFSNSIPFWRFLWTGRFALYMYFVLWW